MAIERLTHRDLKHWKHSLINADGSHGAHFTTEEIETASQGLSLDMESYNIHELCMTANMIYSDFGQVLGRYISATDVKTYVMLAKCFLEDKDSAVKGWHKLAKYYDEIVLSD